MQSGGEVITNAEIEAIHNGLVAAWQREGYPAGALSDPRLRGAFILGLCRAIEFAVIERIAPELVERIN